MSAIPLYRAAPRQTLIVKLYRNPYSLDPFSDRLNSQGYEVLNASTYQAGLELARKQRPALIVVHDDPVDGIDALRWIELQHTDQVAALAMIPLIILADATRVPLLRREEQPDRVMVLQNRADTLNQLTRTIKHVLRAWGIEGDSAR
jgi:DNA-binding response OmpR family regulator